MRNDRGFTLIELLVVIAIILVIAIVLVPGIWKAANTHRSNAQAHTESCAPTQATTDTWIFPCEAEPFAHAFSNWRLAHPEQNVRMVIPFAYRFRSDTRVLVIVDRPAEAR